MDKEKLKIYIEDCLKTVSFLDTNDKYGMMNNVLLNCLKIAYNNILKRLEKGEFD